MDGVHDMGGMHGFGRVVEPGSESAHHERWEPRVFAYYAAWLDALEALLAERGLLDRARGR